MNIFLTELKRVMHILPPDILDRRVQKMNFHLSWYIRNCTWYAHVYDRGSTNLCDSTCHRLFNAYSIGSVVRAENVSFMDQVVISDNDFAVLVNFLRAYISDHPACSQEARQTLSVIDENNFNHV
jgi:hypothetical protein